MDVAIADVLLPFVTQSDGGDVNGGHPVGFLERRTYMLLCTYWLAAKMRLGSDGSDNRRTIVITKSRATACENHSIRAPVVLDLAPRLYALIPTSILVCVTFSLTDCPPLFGRRIENS